MPSHLPYYLLPALLCGAWSVADAAPLTLENVLQRAGDGQGYAAADAELEARQAARDQRQSEAGWEMFGNANVGHYRELVTNDLRDDYYGRSYGIGLRYPLLGTLRRKVKAIQTADLDVRQSAIEQGLQHSQQRLALRSTYADWWRATEEQHLCSGVEQAAQQAEKQVQQRLAGKWILPSDAQLMRSEWTAVTRRCALQRDLLADTRTRLQTLGVSLDDNDSPVPVALAAKPNNLAAWQALLEDNPRIAARQADLTSAENRRQQPWYMAVDSYFTVAQTREERSGASANGSGLSAGITVSAPLDILAYGTARNREGQARYRAAAYALDRERGELLRELGKVLEQQRRNLDEYVWRSERRTAIDSIISERRQRGVLDAGEASLRLLQAEVDRYNASFAMIAAWHGAWLQDAELRLFGDDSAAFANLLGTQALSWQGPVAQPQEVDAPTSGWNQGVYVWDSAPLLDKTQQPSQLAALNDAGMQVIHLGLNSVQVANLDHTLPDLRDLLGAAHAAHLRINLLLGDPTWLKSSQRHLLIELIQRLRSLPFDGLQLDLEVEQLGWPVPDQRLRDWLATLVAAKQASPWPLSMTSHPRWFSDEAQRNPCIPCELPKTGVQTVELMIYSRNPTTSQNRALAIAQQWPGLNWRLAQSVESDQPADLTWAGVPAAQLSNAAAAWQTTLAPARFGGVDWQSWADYPRSK